MNPGRRALTPILIYCEGLQDQAFVRHLHRLYKPRDSRYHFNILKGAGGSPRSLVVKASSLPGSCDCRLVVCDSDRGSPEVEAAFAVAADRGIKLITFQPCLEAVILAILDPGRDWSGSSTGQCKRHLHRNYIDQSKRSDPDQYLAVKRSLVDQARKSHQPLNQMISLLADGPGSGL